MPLSILRNLPRLSTNTFIGTGFLIIFLLGAIYLLAIPLVQSTMRAAEERAGWTIIVNIYELVEMGETDFPCFAKSQSKNGKAN